LYSTGRDVSNRRCFTDKLNNAMSIGEEVFNPLHRVSKNCAKLFLSELRQITTNLYNFWQKDDKEAKIMRYTLISTLSNLCHHTTMSNADVPNCYATL